MKRLIYQMFVLGVGKVEIFFLLSVSAAFVFYPNHFLTITTAFLLPIIFIKKKSGFFIAVLILALHLFSINSLLITGVKSDDGSKRVYLTTGGTLVSSQYLSPGDIITGGFTKRKYSGEPDGRFSRGYFIADKDGYQLSIPFISTILNYRQNLSERLFESSGGKLRLTQGVVLGDKKYLESDTTDKYFLTGLGHLLAISGLHVGLYGMVCFFLLSFLPYKVRLVFVSCMLLALIPFTGFKIPVLRAGLIGVSVAVARVVDYGTDFKKLLLFFAGLFILISPNMIASPSFLLSFSAVYGLLHMDMIRVRRLLSPFMVGLVATAFIIPAASTIFGSYNISSVISTPILIPILSLQVIVFIIYLFIPSLSLEPLILLEKLHLLAVDIFADKLSFMFTLYKTELVWAILMGIFLILCIRLRIFWACFLLLFIPYIPANVSKGGYVPNMGKSKGFVIVDDKTHIFYKGDHGSFIYSFLPYLATLGVESADSGSINIYGTENVFIPIAEENGDYGWMCVNGIDEKCKAIYHTRSNTYKCDDDKVHILYKNRCKTDKTYILNETGDLKIAD